MRKSAACGSSLRNVRARATKSAWTTRRRRRSEPTERRRSTRSRRRVIDRSIGASEIVPAVGSREPLLLLPPPRPSLPARRNAGSPWLLSSLLLLSSSSTSPSVSERRDSPPRLTSIDPSESRNHRGMSDSRLLARSSSLPRRSPAGKSSRARVHRS